MAEEFDFATPEQIQEAETRDSLAKEGGITYRTETDPDSGETRSFVNVLGVEVPTYASREDVRKIATETQLTALDQEMLWTIATCYKLRQPLMFEGRPGAGKTYLSEQFAKLIHGSDAEILTLYGSPKTTELDILGHWAPRGLKADAQKKYEDKLKEVMGGEEMTGYREDFNKRIEDLSRNLKDNKMTEEEFGQEFEDLSQDYVSRTGAIMAESMKDLVNLGTGATWEFKKGALLQAYTGREGKGYILNCEEFNMIPSNYQQIFLQIGGVNGGLSDRIHFWGSTEQTSYPRGQDTWIFFASNFPEATPGRSEVVAPLTDRVVWKVISDQDAAGKDSMMIRSAGGRLRSRAEEYSRVYPETLVIPMTNQVEWASALDEKLGEEVADLVEAVHHAFVTGYKAIGDKITVKGEERDRSQLLESTPRNAYRLFSYLDHNQVRDPDTGVVDFPATLTKAFELYYVSRLVSAQQRERVRNEFGVIMSDDIGQKVFEGRTITRAEIFHILAERLPKPKIEDERSMLKDMTTFDKDLGQTVGDLLLNNRIPESVKDIFQIRFLRASMERAEAISKDQALPRLIRNYSADRLVNLTQVEEELARNQNAKTVGRGWSEDDREFILWGDETLALLKNAKTQEDFDNIIHQLSAMEKLYQPIRNWEYEGEITVKNVLLDQHIGGWVRDAKFVRTGASDGFIIAGGDSANTYRFSRKPDGTYQRTSPINQIHPVRGLTMYSSGDKNIIITAQTHLLKFESENLGQPSRPLNLFEYKTTSSEVVSMGSSDDGKQVALGTINGEIRLFNIDTDIPSSSDAKRFKIDTKADGWPTKVKFSHDGRFLAVGTTMGRMCIYDAHTPGRDLLDKVEPLGPIKDIQFSSDDTTAWVVSSRGLVTKFEIEEDSDGGIKARRLETLQAGFDNATAASINRTGDGVALGYENGRVEVYSLKQLENGSPKKISTFRASDSVQELEFGEFGDKLLVGCRSGRLYVIGDKRR